jgi:hypothetical protein
MSQECPMHCFDFAVVSLCEGPCYRRNVKISLNYRSPLHNILNSFGIYLFHTINFLISYHNYFAVLSVDHLVWISIASRNTFCSGAWTLSIPFTVTAYRRFNGRSRTKASPSPSSFSSTVVGGSNYSSQISFNQVFIIHKMHTNYLRGFKYFPETKNGTKKWTLRRRTENFKHFLQHSGRTDATPTMDSSNANVAMAIKQPLVQRQLSKFTHEEFLWTVLGNSHYTVVIDSV